MSELATLEPQTPEEVESSAQLLEQATEPKRQTKHGLRVSSERKLTIYTLHDQFKWSARAIADRLSMDWRTVAAVLSLRDSDAVIARNLLTTHSLGFAKDWVTAAKKGAQRGRHEPARDALYALGVVSPPQQAQQSQQVTVILSGGEMPTELKIGVLQTQQGAPKVAGEPD
jgi:hypothetical protein